MASRSVIISAEEWENNQNVKPTTTVLCCPTRASNRTPALGDRKGTRTVGDQKRRVEKELPEWLQPFRDVSPADVTVPLPAIPPSAHLPAKLTSSNSGNTIY